MATSDPCANAPPTPPEEPEPSPSPRKKRGRRKVEQTEKNKGKGLIQTFTTSVKLSNSCRLRPLFLTLICQWDVLYISYFWLTSDGFSYFSS